VGLIPGPFNQQSVIVVFVTAVVAGVVVILSSDPANRFVNGRFAISQFYDENWNDDGAWPQLLNPKPYLSSDLTNRSSPEYGIPYGSQDQP
jgi:hypothetical protein